MDIAMVSAFVLYFATLITIGLFFYKRKQSAQEFMLGNRSVNYWVTAIATQTSDMGAWLFMAFPAMVFALGMFQIWTAVGLVAGMWVTWTYTAPKLRKRTASLNSLTLSSYLASSFGDTSGRIQFFSTGFALFFFVFYIASGLVGLSLVFSVAFGFSYEMGIVISVVTAAVYTLVGGFVAVAWCDFIQGLFLLCMIILVPLYGLITIGGISPILAAARENNISLSFLASPKDTLWALFLAASWGLGYFGQPHILVNLMGIDSEDNIKRARAIGISWQVIVLIASVSIGLVGIGFFDSGISNTELVFPAMTMALFHPFFAGLILCAVFAATLSTMDSLILVAGTSIGEDVYKKFFNKEASAQQVLLVSRIGALVVAAIALLFAWRTSWNVYELVNYAWSGLGSSFGPLVFASLFSKNITPQGALAGLIAGGATAAIWPFFLDLLPLVPGFSIGIVVLFVVSWMTRQD